MWSFPTRDLASPKAKVTFFWSGPNLKLEAKADSGVLCSAHDFMQVYSAVLNIDHFRVSYQDQRCNTTVTLPMLNRSKLASNRLAD